MKKFVLVGNSENGKSFLFSKLLQHVSDDFFSTSQTLEIIKGNSTYKNNEIQEEYELIDTPGINNLFSSDENVQTTYKFLSEKEYDAILFVADINKLKRSLALFLQLTLLNKPILFLANMYDTIDDLPFSIDFASMEKILGTKVLPVSVLKNINIDILLTSAFKAQIPQITLTYPKQFRIEFDRLKEKYSFTNQQFNSFILKTCGFNILDSISEQISDKEFNTIKTNLDELNRFKRMDLFITDLSFQESYSIVEEVTKPKLSQLPFLEKFGIWAQRPLTGIPIMIGMLTLMYVFVGMFGATYLVDNFASKIFQPYLIPWTARFFSLFHNQFIYDVFMDPNFGIVTTGLFLAIGIVLPVLITYYFFVGLLEDAGYFARLSVLLDKSMRPMGLNGKGILPLVMGFSCITMAILSTRVLDTKKEKIIATFLLILGLPCAPLMSTMFIVLGKMPWTAAFTIFGIILSQIFIGGILANFILKDKQSDFILDVPAIRIPKISLVLYSTYRKTLIFLKEAIPIFMFASFLFFVAQYLGFLTWLEDVSKPLVVHFWGLPKESVQVIIKTMIRRENGVAELARLQHLFTNTQIVITLLLMTLLIPCINSIMMIIKERGFKIGMAIMLSVLAYSTIFGGIIHFIFDALNITFI